MYKQTLLQSLGVDIEDVTHLITRPPLFTPSEQIELTECAMILIEAKIKENPLLYSNPHFHDIISESTLSVLLEQLSSLSIADDDEVEDELESLVSNAFKTIYQTLSPRRSCRRTFIRRKPIVDTMQHKIQYLQSIDQPAQGTSEWYSFRWGIMSASNAWKAFASDAVRNSLIYEKCKPINPDKYGSVNMDSPLHHGHKYEPVSVLLYEHMFDTKVGEFGCIPHPTIHYLGASPDGINIDPKSDRFGRMLEIKNIVNRVINGIPKVEYWTQMQLQMETCNLNECDFLETQFVEYPDEASFKEDGTFNLTKNNELKGVMLCFLKNGKPHYSYAPIGISESDFHKWEQNEMLVHQSIPNCEWIKVIYWKMTKMSCVLVLRNKLWFAAALPVLERTWQAILKGRDEGYEQYAPKGVKRSNSSGAPKITVKSKCLIDSNDIMEVTPVQEVVAQAEKEATVTPPMMVIETETEPTARDKYLSEVLNSDKGQ